VSTVNDNMKLTFHVALVKQHTHTITSTSHVWISQSTES